jgi:8-oxo-dGTP pyrophosphatase MutT (NUDIX family)
MSELHPPDREVAVGLIVDDGGRVLLQHRDDKPGILESGLWGFFGGHIEPNERPAEAFLREVEEEIGWRPRHFEQYGVFRAHTDGIVLGSNVFAAHLDVPVDALTLNEGRGMALFDPYALPTEIAADLPRIISEFASTDAYKRVRRRWDVITATAVIVDERGRFLLQHRDDKPDIANPGMWGSFGGEIEPYETPLDGYLRELEEELAWRPDVLELIGSTPFSDGSGRRQLIYLYASPLDRPYGELVLGEGQAMGLFGPDELPPKTHPVYERYLREFAQTVDYQRLVALAGERSAA